jgi:hypothetical protein
MHVCFVRDNLAFALFRASSALLYATRQALVSQLIATATLPDVQYFRRSSEQRAAILYFFSLVVRLVDVLYSHESLHFIHI